MEPIFIYCNNLTFDQNKRFILEFSDDDLLEGVLFKKNKDCYITSMSCYVDLTVEFSDLSNTILAEGEDFGY